MKKFIFLTSIIIFSCASKNEIIQVQYTASKGIELLSSTVFKEIEIVVLKGEEAPIPGPHVNMIVKNDTYYISDPIHSGKVHLFNSSGEYMNSVGEIGRGPMEYIDLSDMIIEENGDISVYSYQGELNTYSPQGRFLRNRAFVYNSRHFTKANGYNYHFFGDGSYTPFQLYITDNNNQLIDSCLVSANVPYFSSTSPVFSTFKDALNLCPNYGNVIYRFVDYKPQVSYTFDFNEYAIPDEYFGKERNDAMSFIMSKTVAIKDLFFENQKYAILQCSVFNFEQGWARYLYGLLVKETSVWKWYYMKEDDFMNNDNLKYMDDSYLYFIAEPTIMRDAGLAERFPVLQTFDVNDGIIIIKCRLGDD